LALSRFAAARASANIVVSNRLMLAARFRTAPHVIPCGVDPELFYPEDYLTARRTLGLGDEPIVLFGSARSRVVKNFRLAEAVVRRVPFSVRLLELNGVQRHRVRTLLSAVDALIVTSNSEGSPQVVKEALLCGCPVVSTDVGDVRELVADVPYCHVESANVDTIAARLAEVLLAKKRVPPMAAFKRFSNGYAAQRIASVYEQVLSRGA
jgi:teichuronic acid biosynthesis glycosyltransferase TuaC